MTTDSLNVKVTADVTHYTSQMENAKKKMTKGCLGQPFSMGFVDSLRKL